MSIELWLGFVLASSLLLVVPGPTVMLVTWQALRRPCGTVLIGAGLWMLAWRRAT